VPWRNTHLLVIEVHPSPLRPHHLKADGPERGNPCAPRRNQPCSRRGGDRRTLVSRGVGESRRTGDPGGPLRSSGRRGSFRVSFRAANPSTAGHGGPRPSCQPRRPAGSHRVRNHPLRSGPALSLSGCLDPGGTICGYGQGGPGRSGGASRIPHHRHPSLLLASTHPRPSSRLIRACRSAGHQPDSVASRGHLEFLSPSKSVPPTTASYTWGSRSNGL